jgi:hypothetical protein
LSLKRVSQGVGMVGEEESKLRLRCQAFKTEGMAVLVIE